jgi:hypothetical protein
MADHGVLPLSIADWANEMRDFGNVGRADEPPESLLSAKDAAQVLTFANTLAEYLFVLPARIKDYRSAGSQ